MELRIFRRWMVLLAASAAMLAPACEETRVLDVRLVHSPDLVPTEVFEDLTIRIIEAAGEEIVMEATVTPDRVGGRHDLLDVSVLQVGRSYVVTLSAPIASNVDACPVRGRAAGRSAPFVHRETSSTVTVQIGCADELAVTRGAPLHARLAHQVVTSGDGEVVIVGGARTLTIRGGESGDWVYQDMVRTVELYDPGTGSFREGGDLRETRAFPAAVRLDGGETAVIGGNQSLDPMCWNTTEVITPWAVEPRALMTQPRCFPAAVSLEGAVAVIGGAVLDPDNAAEVLDATLGRRVTEPARGTPFRVRPTVLALSDRTSALVAGGADGEPTVQVLRVDEAGNVSFETVSGALPPASWAGSGAYVRCEDGGGAVYLVGGLVDGREMAEAWCYLDRPGGGSVVRAGSLDAARANHVTLAVRGPEGRQRLLVIGGSREADILDDALLIPVNGCECQPVGERGEITSIPLPEGFVALHHAASTLLDGSVLVVGGTSSLEADGDDTSFHAAAISALFVPDGDR